MDTLIIIIVLLSLCFLSSSVAMAVAMAVYFMTREHEVIEMINNNKKRVWKVKEVICDDGTCDEVTRAQKGESLKYEIDNDFIVMTPQASIKGFKGDKIDKIHTIREKYIIDGDKIKIGKNILYKNKDLKNSLVLDVNLGIKPYKLILEY